MGEQKEVMAYRYYEEKDTARRYVLYRPTYAKELIKYIVDYYKEGRGPHCNYQLAVDVGCGNGQSTLPLAEYFHRVVGCDISREQISQAPSDVDRVEFRVCPSEQLAFLEANSVDLLTVAMAFHWFDQDSFCKEAKRVLKPGGVLAIYRYTPDIFDKQEDQAIINDVMASIIRKNERVKDLLALCDGYTLPFPEWKKVDCDPTLCIRNKWSLSRLIGFLSTLDAELKTVEMAEERFAQLYNCKDKKDEPLFDVKIPIILLIGRKSVLES